MHRRGQRCKKRVEAAARAARRAGETLERMAVWSSSHRASSLRQEVWSLLLLPFLTCWDSLDQALLGHMFSLRIKQGQYRSMTTSLKDEEGCTKPKSFCFEVVCFPLCHCFPLRAEKQ